MLIRRDLEERWKQPPEMFCKKSVFKNLANFTGKYLFWGLFFIKLQVKKSPKQVFSCEICDIFKSTFFEERLQTTASRIKIRAVTFKKIT